MTEAQSQRSGCRSNCRALTAGLTVRTGNARDGEKHYEAFGRSSGIAWDCAFSVTQLIPRQLYGRSDETLARTQFVSSLRPRAGAPLRQCLAQRETGGHALRERHSYNAVAEGEIKSVGINAGDFPCAVCFTEELRRV
jgi:hypothetical protein